MPKISVVIPVYNAENHLRECVASLLAQTETDCEFIFVDDGSTDDSAEIISEFAQTDSRIKQIGQENQGVSAARNAGISMANGDYLGFVDADDFIEKDMFAVLLTHAEKSSADIVVSNFYAEQGSAKLLVQFDFPVNHFYGKAEIRERIFPYFIEKDLMNSACNKIFRHELIARNEIQFPLGVALGEDAIFNMKAFNKAEAVYYTDYAGYHYREVAGSATRNILGKDYFQKALDAFAFDYKSHLELELSEDEILKFKSIRLINSVLSLIHLYFYNSGASLKMRFKAVREMIGNPDVSRIVSENFGLLSQGKSAYAKFLLKSVKNRDIYKLYFATLYSKFRNR